MGGGVGDHIPAREPGPDELAEFLHNVREGISDPITPELDNFRHGDEAPDVVDGGVQMFVGDPRARDVIKRFGVDNVPDAEQVVDAFEEHAANEMGIPHEPQRTFEDIIASYERELGGGE